ncbi:MAG: heparinase II/III family protein [Planctomycetota bacterium]|nr:heparinase II/III family protein [Planctomycetota bacterium]
MFYGWPHVFCPEYRSLTIDDVWPSLYIGAHRIDEIKRKASELDWARQAIELWQEEAEEVLAEEPLFVEGIPGGRTSMYRWDQGQHLIFDHTQPKTAYDPLLGSTIELNQKNKEAWVLLCHERIRRLMSSLAFLYGITGDERYSDWVWEGLRNSVKLYQSPNSGSDKPYSWVYGGLYEAQSMLQLLQSVELVKGAPGGSGEDLQAVRNEIFVPVCDTLSRWMDKMLVHNMSCWSDAALALVGKFLGNDEHVEKALYSERAGLKKLLEVGLPKAPDGGPPDGFWFETSSFYNFYALIPLCALHQMLPVAADIWDKFEGHFFAMFEAPIHLADEHLRVVPVGDRYAPGAFYLPYMRHVFEYGAGILPERIGPLLSLLYQASGAPRNSLAALAYGPDELPPPREKPKTSVVMRSAKMATFRGQWKGDPVTLWFLGGNDYHAGQAHHHSDKLSFSLHAKGRILTSDLGLPGSQDNDWAQYLFSSFSHNTMFVDELAQGPMKSLEFNADVDAEIPWAKAKVQGNWNGIPPSLQRAMQGRGDEIDPGANEEVVLTRALHFSPPLIQFVDTFESPVERRFSSAFHCYGNLIVDTQPSAEELALPALPAHGALSLLTEKHTCSSASKVVADWRVDTGLFLRLVATADRSFEVTWGRTPGNPSIQTRGTLLLRTAAAKCEFQVCLELHSGSPATS